MVEKKNKDKNQSTSSYSILQGGFHNIYLNGSHLPFTDGRKEKSTRFDITVVLCWIFKDRSCDWIGWPLHSNDEKGSHLEFNLGSRKHKMSVKPYIKGNLNWKQNPNLPLGAF